MTKTPIIKFYDTLTRTEREFAPLGSPVTLYTCGPTVYDVPHLGNWRTFTFDDLLRRWLRFNGYQVRQIMNITDVDDKTIDGSQKAKQALETFTKPYLEAFERDRDALNIQEAEVYPQATEFIGAMAQMVADLLKEGSAYRGDDGSIYFRVSGFADYGKLAQLQKAALKPTGRVKHDEYDKEAIADFALWKAWDAKDGEVFWPKEKTGDWPPEIPKGRPGWHIECSAMIRALLGDQIDIHTGGVDNIFPHHQNEIAQTETLTKKPLAQFWLHAEHLLLNGEKMAKSKGNVTTLEDVIKDGFDPLAVRYLLLAAHYRSKLDFTEDGLKAARAARQSLIDAVAGLQAPEGKSQDVYAAYQKMGEALGDDLNTPVALAAVHQVAKLTKADPHLAGAAQFFEAVESIFGLGLFKPISVSKEVQTLVSAREGARKQGDFTEADAIRSKIEDKGYRVEDTPEGPKIYTISH